MSCPPFDAVYGVDFSGARLAGRATWVARLEPAPGGPAPYRLTSLRRLADLARTAERDAALAHLVRLVGASCLSLWAINFPFGLPVEVADGVTWPGAPWAAQLRFLYAWRHDPYGAGVRCLRAARELGGPGHLRRLTDRETRAPFDPYHYRIIYQTYFGMWSVLRPLLARECTAVLPFQYRRLARARRVVVESCPSSTLKRLGLPYHNYKQIAAGALEPRRRRTRRDILAGLAPHVTVSPHFRAALLRRDNGGDALDAVLSAVGAAHSWAATDHAAVAGHPRYVREGRQYV